MDKEYTNTHWGTEMFAVPFVKTSTIIHTSAISQHVIGVEIGFFLLPHFHFEICVDCTVLLFYQVYIHEKETIAADTCKYYKDLSIFMIRQRNQTPMVGWLCDDIWRQHRIVDKVYVIGVGGSGQIVGCNVNGITAEAYDAKKSVFRSWIQWCAKYHRRARLIRSRAMSSKFGYCVALWCWPQNQCHMES